MSSYHLTYIGANGIVFDSLQPRHTTDPNSVNLHLIRGQVLFNLRDLHQGSFGPPVRVWTNGLPLFFPGTEIDLVTRNVEIPVTSLLAPFFHHPASKSTVQEILDQSSAWVSRAELAERAALFPKRPSIRTLVKRWIKERDANFEANSARRKVCTEPYLDWSFLDLIALANWGKVGIECRIEAILYALVVAVSKISRSEAEYLESYDAEGLEEADDTAFYKYLKDRAYEGIERGPYSNEEKMDLRGGLGEPDLRPDPPGFKSEEDPTLT